MGALAKHDKLYFDPKFAFEVALQYEPLNIVMQRYDVTMEDLKKLRKHQPFIVAVRNHQKDIKENGLTFKLKSKMLAEELLEDSFLLAKDSNIPPAVRTKNIENIVRWGELEPAKKTGEGSDTGPQFNIQINLGD